MLKHVQGVSELLAQFWEKMGMASILPIIGNQCHTYKVFHGSLHQSS